MDKQPLKTCIGELITCLWITWKTLIIINFLKLQDRFWERLEVDHMEKINIWLLLSPMFYKDFPILKFEKLLTSWLGTVFEKWATQNFMINSWRKLKKTSTKWIGNVFTTLSTIYSTEITKVKNCGKESSINQLKWDMNPFCLILFTLLSNTATFTLKTIIQRSTSTLISTCFGMLRNITTQLTNNSLLIKMNSSKKWRLICVKDS